MSDYGYVCYSGNGQTTNFIVPFSFISRTYVTLKVGGVDTSITWVNDGLISITPAPGTGVKVEITRTTPLAPLEDYEDSAFLTGTSLNLSQTQFRNLTEEVKDAVSRAALIQGTVPLRNLVFPSPVPNSLVGWDSAAEALKLYPTVEDFSNVLLDHIGNYNDDLANAVTLIGSSRKLLLIHKAITVSTEFTIPQNICLWILPEGKLVFDVGANVTIHRIMSDWYSFILDIQGGVFKLGKNVISSPFWTGAKGDGSTVDNTAFQQILDNYPDGGTMFIPRPPVFYRVNTPLMTFNVSMVGEETKSHIKNLIATNTPNAKVLQVGNWGGFEDLNHGVTKAETPYECEDIAAGTSLVTLKTPAEAEDFSVGDLVYLFDSNVIPGTENVDPTKQYLENGSCNIVQYIDTQNGILTLKYTVADDYIAVPGEGGTPVQIFRDSGNVTGLFHNWPAKCARNVRIANLKLEQSTWIYQLCLGVSAVESVFQDLELIGSCGMGINPAAYNIFERIKIYGPRKYSETDYLCNNNTFRDILVSRNTEYPVEYNADAGFNFGQLGCDNVVQRLVVADGGEGTITHATMMLGHKRTIVEYSTIHSTPKSGIVCTMYRGKGCIVRHNTIMNSTVRAIMVQKGANDCQVYQNTIINPGDHGIYIDGNDDKEASKTRRIICRDNFIRGINAEENKYAVEVRSHVYDSVIEGNYSPDSDIQVLGALDNNNIIRGNYTRTYMYPAADLTLVYHTGTTDATVKKSYVIVPVNTSRPYALRFKTWGYVASTAKAGTKNFTIKLSELDENGDPTGSPLTVDSMEFANGESGFWDFSGSILKRRLTLPDYTLYGHSIQHKTIDGGASTSLQARGNLNLTDNTVYARLDLVITHSDATAISGLHEFTVQPLFEGFAN